MAADLFETYAVTAVAVMLLGVLTFNEQREVAIYPLVHRRRLDHRLDDRHLRRARARGNVERALYQGLIVSAVIAAAAFLPITHWLMDDLTSKTDVADSSRGAVAPAGSTLALHADRPRHHRAACS